MATGQVSVPLGDFQTGMANSLPTVYKSTPLITNRTYPQVVPVKVLYSGPQRIPLPIGVLDPVLKRVTGFATVGYMGIMQHT
jgi:hypothetical protein